MKKYWQLLSQYIEERSLSERILIFCAAAGVMISVWSTLLLDPVFDRSDALRTMISQQQSQILALADRTRTLSQSLRDPSGAAGQAHVRALAAELDKVNFSLDELLQQQVSPQQMVALLKDMLQQNHQVRLVSFKTLPVTLFTLPPEHTEKPSPTPTPTQGTATQEPLIYKHGVEFTVDGSYGDLLGYLNELEHLPWQLFFGDLSFMVTDYPHEHITMVLYTLCTDRAWLSM